jgi:1-acyl-sn-glycerol-3-phosphate acyltransferase
MLFFLPALIRGVIGGVLLLINIIIMSALIIVVGLLKYILPFKAGKRCLTRIQNDTVTSLWSDLNFAIVSLVTNIEWDIRRQGDLNFNHWYFVFANHQSWADIIILQHVFNRKIRLLKFFLKQELLWSLPIGGLACWMLDYPVMKRYSKTYLKKHPEKKEADLNTAKAACNLFKLRPTTVMNFLEGTRFTPEKQKERSSPYKHLLRPKSGGVALVLAELKDYIKEIVDVTVIYDHPDPTFWHFISGQIRKVTVIYEVVSVNEHQYGDYYHDSAYRRRFQQWINSIWQKKDKTINGLKENEQRVRDLINEGGGEKTT